MARRPYHLTLWDYWQLQDCERLDRILAEHDQLDGAFLMHYAVNNPDALKRREQDFQLRHTYRTPAGEAMSSAEGMIGALAELAAYNARVARRQRRAGRTKNEVQR